MTSQFPLQFIIAVGWPGKIMKTMADANAGSDNKDAAKMSSSDLILGRHIGSTITVILILEYTVKAPSEGLAINVLSSSESR